MKATLIKADGTVLKIEPENGTDFKLKELYKLLECDLVEVVYPVRPPFLEDCMIIDEEGKLKDNPVINKLATNIYGADVIVGHALICSKEQFK